MTIENEITQEEKAKVLQITNNLYKKHKDKIFKQVPKYRDPDSGMCLRDFIQAGIDSKTTTKEEKEKLENFLWTGLIDETEEVVDDKNRIKYEKALDKKLIAEVKKGNLPKIILKNIK